MFGFGKKKRPNTMMSMLPKVQQPRKSSYLEERVRLLQELKNLEQSAPTSINEMKGHYVHLMLDSRDDFRDAGGLNSIVTALFDKALKKVILSLDRREIIEVYYAFDTELRAMMPERRMTYELK